MAGNAAWLEQVAADPAQLLGDLPKRYAAAVSLHVANIPQMYGDLAVSQIQLAMQMVLQRPQPGETEDAREAKKRMADKVPVAGQIR